MPPPVEEVVAGAADDEHVLDRGDALILRRGGAGGGDERVTGRVGNKMKMKIACSLRHDRGARLAILSMPVEKATPYRIAQAPWLDNPLFNPHSCRFAP